LPMRRPGRQGLPLFSRQMPAHRPAGVTVLMSGCRSPRLRPYHCGCGQFPPSLRPFGRRPSPGESGHRPPIGRIRVHSRVPRNRCRRRRRWRHLGRRPRPRRRDKGRRQGCGHVPIADSMRARDRQPGRTDQDSRDARARRTT
jgi:hypothetical protein